jgi:hypothetical protein
MDSSTSQERNMPLYFSVSRKLRAMILAGLLAPVLPASAASLSQDLGGAAGIFKFLEDYAVPALVADPLVGPFFNGEKFSLSESPTQISACLAMLLDKQLGGSSPKSGALVPDPTFVDHPLHICRSSMAKVHEFMRLGPAEFDQFVKIVADQAKLAGIPDKHIAALGKALNRSRKAIVQTP